MTGNKNPGTMPSYYTISSFYVFFVIRVNTSDIFKINFLTSESIFHQLVIHTTSVYSQISECLTPVSDTLLKNKTVATMMTHDGCVSWYARKSVTGFRRTWKYPALGCCTEVKRLFRVVIKAAASDISVCTYMENTCTTLVCN